jgi:predicted P-loop ATPase
MSTDLVFIRDANDRIAADDQRNIRQAVIAGLGAAFTFDEFADQIWVTWQGRRRAFDDALADQLWLAVDATYGFRPARDFFVRVLVAWARSECAVHPVREYLDRIVWDGSPRLDRWLTTYGGAPDTPFTRAAGATTLIGAIRRVRRPGTKLDTLLVLEGAQGVQKSTAIASLCPCSEWFSDAIALGSDPKITIEKTRGIWIAEIAELQGFSESKIEALKAFLSRQVDGPTRLAYDRLPSRVPRSFVLIATTNSREYLKDPSGNRRFLPVPTPQFDISALRRDRDQLWAEAAAREADGEAIILDPSLWAVAAVEQEQRRIIDPWEEVFMEQRAFDDPAIPVSRLWGVLGKDVNARDPRAGRRINDIMTARGYVKVKNTKDGNKLWWCKECVVPARQTTGVVRYASFAPENIKGEAA